MDYVWSETGHVCRVCMGPVMLRMHQGRHIARCMSCGAQAEGSYKQVCACGTKRGRGQDAYLRCAPNPNVSAEFPQLVMIRYVEKEIRAAQKRERRPTDCTSDERQGHLLNQETS